MHTRSYSKQIFLVSLLTILLFISADSICNSMAFGATWARTYRLENSNRASCIQHTSDGGYIVAGWATNAGIWLLKLDTNGEIQWQKAYFGSGTPSVQETLDGGYVVTSSYPFGPIWILKLDANGETQWQKNYGQHCLDLPPSIQQTSDSGYIVAGSSLSQGYSDIWVLKLDVNGEIQWQKTYGGPDNDYASSIQQTIDGGYIVAGTSCSLAAHSISVLKLDTSGNIEWQKAFGSLDGSTNFWASAIRQTAEGEYAVAGIGVSGSLGPSGSLVLKLDANGSIQWQKIFSTGGGFDQVVSFRETSDGGYIMAGRTKFFRSDAWIIKVDSNGNIQWQKIYGDQGDDEASSIVQTSDGGYAVAGYTSNLGYDLTEYLVLKLDGNGNLLFCSNVRETTATAIDASAIGQDINLTVSASTISPQISHGIGVTANGSTGLICGPVSLFNDVPQDHWGNSHILALYNAGITAGCGTGNYCPDSHITRGQMAVFIERSLGAPLSPPCTGNTFNDVNLLMLDAGFCGYIEDCASKGIAVGCQEDDPATQTINEAGYCPHVAMTRAEMAVFVERALGVDPAVQCTGGVFSDVNAQTVGDLVGRYTRTSQLGG